MRKVLIIAVSCLFALQLQAEENKDVEKKNLEWKAKYFKANPEADLDQDGELSWYEYHTHKELQDKKVLSEKEKESAENYKADFFKKYPKADTDKDGKLSWLELKLYKADLEKAKK